MSLRGRLTLIYTVLLLAGFAAAGVLGYLIVAHRIYSSVDESLKVRAQAVSAELLSLPALTPDAITQTRPGLEALSSVDSAVQIYGARDSILYSEEPSSARLPPPDDPATREASFSNRDVDGVEHRILFQPIVRDDQSVGTIEIGQSLEGPRSAVRDIRNVFILVGLAVAMATCVSAYVLAGRALSRIRQVSQLARDIEQTANFNRRLAEPRTGDEVAELIATFNAMIKRVENTLLAQKSFLADSSHELRRPLTVVRTNIDILGNPNLPEGERKQCVKDMHREAELMGRLLSELLLLSREESQAIERMSVDLTAVCERVASNLQARNGNHQWSRDIEAGVHVVGDPERLEQMVRNLLDNAIHYTPRGGRIEIRLKSEHLLARLQIKDNGVGIEEADLPRIFDRFYRGQNARRTRGDGVGLGLSIVKYIAEAHGGAVRANSRSQHGSDFQVDLPMTQSSAPARPRQKRASRSSSPRTHG